MIYHLQVLIRQNIGILLKMEVYYLKMLVSGIKKNIGFIAMFVTMILRNIYVMSQVKNHGVSIVHTQSYVIAISNVKFVIKTRFIVAKNPKCGIPLEMARLLQETFSKQARKHFGSNAQIAMKTFKTN
tara:strand:- start:5472 stop:5855 length:384 start_codon:yes stop_codon:yes gene_type:complete